MLQAAVCTGDTDCGTGECCYIEPEFMVVSKRQLELLPESAKRDTGINTHFILWRVFV